MTYRLKIKIKSLAAEAAIIRHEERRVTRSIDWTKAHEPAGSNHSEVDALRGKRWNLRAHRIYEVRSEQRASLLAYGYLRGKAYASIEQSSRFGRPAPNWDKVATMALKYGRGDKVPSFGPNNTATESSRKKEMHETLKVWAALRIMANSPHIHNVVTQNTP